MSDTSNTPIRCEGYRRYGGAFTLGPVKWEQCKENATVMITIEQDGKVSDFPACNTCGEEGRQKGLKQIAAKPIIPTPSCQPQS